MELPNYRSKLSDGGYSDLRRLPNYTLEQVLSTCNLNLDDLFALQQYMAEMGVTFRWSPVRYPFANPLLVQQVRSRGIDLSRTSISAIGLPRWATDALHRGNVFTVAELAEASTFYIRTVIGRGGRPQSYIKGLLEEYLLRLIETYMGDVEGPQSERARDIRSLGLNSRTLNALRRAGVFTLDQLQRLSDEDLRKLGGIGNAGIHQIRSTLPKASSVPVTEPNTAAIAETITILPDRAHRSIRELNLPETTLYKLESAGICTVGDLLGAEAEHVARIPRIGKISAQRINTAVESYLLAELSNVGSGLPKQVWEAQAEAAAASLDLRMSHLIGRLRSTRQRTALSLRFGLDGKFRTLEEAGTELKVTRQRVRQMIATGIEKLRTQYPAESDTMTVPLCEALKQVGGVAPSAYFIGQIPLIYALDQIPPAGALMFLITLCGDYVQVAGGVVKLSSAHVTDAQLLDRSIERALRENKAPLSIEELTIQLADSPWLRNILQRYPSFSLAARARANPRTTVTIDGRVSLAEWKRTRKDEAISVLREIGHAENYQVIARMVNESVPPEMRVTVRGLYNLLASEPEFIRTARATFGLAEWGLTEPVAPTG